MPIDDIEQQTAREHFRVRVSRVFLPFVRFSDAEASSLPLTLEGIICRQSAAHGFLHHRYAVVGERTVVHQIPATNAATELRQRRHWLEQPSKKSKEG
jgi:hypothetical protein